MTDPKEIERVRAIHASAESYLQTIASGGWAETPDFCFGGCGRNIVWWTRAELLAWPEAKARMRATLDGNPRIVVATSRTGLNEEELVRHNNGTKFYQCEGIDRGLCLYRELLDAAPVADPCCRCGGSCGTSTWWWGNKRLCMPCGLKGPEASVAVVASPESPALEGKPTERPACASCSASFTPAPVAEFKDTTRCVYCQFRECGLVAYTDTTPALSQALPDRTPRRAPSRHDARPVDLEQAWSTPGWES